MRAPRPASGEAALDGRGATRVAPRSHVIALTTLLLTYLALASGYQAATRAWDNPDEPAHFNYVRQVAETGSLPVLQAGDWDGALLERLKSTRFPPTESIDAIRYESWQPPLYYVLAAPVYAAAPPAARLAWLRFLDVLLGAGTLVAAYGVGRALFGAADWRAVALPTTLVGIPMFTAMSAALTNDALANLLATVATWVSLLAVRSARPRRLALVLGVVLGAGLLTKLTLLVFLPIGTTAAAWGASRIGGRGAAVRASGTVVGIAVGAWLPWLVRNALTYGWNDPLASRRHDLVVAEQARFPGFTFEHLSYLAATTFHSFWAQFGWMAFPVDDRLYGVWGAFAIAGCVGLVWAAIGTGRGRLLHLAPWFVTAATVVGMLAALGYYNLTYIQAQGRYLFPAGAGLAGFAVLGWARLGGRYGGPVALGTAAALVVLNVLTLYRWASPALAGPP
ncbi:MAG: glycosyltransferase family 39 protein [Chloroflexi bacterium]|nr:glycosyltransferase family 39 protein [Chloroflexota bacterium]